MRAGCAPELNSRSLQIKFMESCLFRYPIYRDRQAVKSKCAGLKSTSLLNCESVACRCHRFTVETKNLAQFLILQEQRNPCCISGKSVLFQKWPVIINVNVM